MTLRSAAVYGGGGLLLVACLAAANMPADDPRPPQRTPAASAAAPDALAVEVQSQAARLRELLAQAPAPGVNPRNPFSFNVARRTVPPSASVSEAPAAAPAVFTPEVPALALIGVAEETSPEGPRRTAIIGADGGALYMVTEGETIADRYRVRKIGADAIELEDLLTKGFRRLALR